MNIRRYNVVCGPGQCEYQEAAAGTAQNWELQKDPNPQLVEVLIMPCPRCLCCSEAASFMTSASHILHSSCPILLIALWRDPVSTLRRCHYAGALSFDVPGGLRQGSVVCKHACISAVNTCGSRVGWRAYPDDSVAVWVHSWSCGGTPLTGSIRWSTTPTARARPSPATAASAWLTPTTWADSTCGLLPPCFNIRPHKLAPLWPFKTEDFSAPYLDILAHKHAPLWSCSRL